MKRFSYEYRVFLIFNFFLSRKQRGGLVMKQEAINEFWELQRKCSPIEFYEKLQRIENNKVVRLKNNQLAPVKKEKHEDSFIIAYKEEINIIMKYVFAVSPFKKRNIAEMKTILQSFNFEGEFLSKKYLPN